MTVGELINTITSQMAATVMDEDREATAEDAANFAQVVVIVLKAFVEKEITDGINKEMEDGRR